MFNYSCSHLYKKGDKYSPIFGCIPRPALPPHMKHLSSNILETLKMKNISSLKLRNLSLETLFYQKWGSNFYFSDIFKNKSWNDTATILTILRYLCTFWGSQLSFLKKKLWISTLKFSKYYINKVLDSFIQKT